MIFSEIYGVYYKAVSEILKASLSGRITSEECRKIIEKYAFSESVLTIEPALRSGKWPLIKPDGTPVIKNIPSFPLSSLQKSWLKAVSLDPRIKLFDISFDIPEDTEPLFTPEDYCVFDKYSDGDDFEDENYIRNFRMILDAVKNRKKLLVQSRNRKGALSELTVIPDFIEYSEKDDKFRLVANSGGEVSYINIGRIISCSETEGQISPVKFHHENSLCALTFELKDERKALERVMLHFSHFEKETVRTGRDTYEVTLKYDRSDRTELVIRILSFGPMIKVTGPEEFKALIKERLVRQKKFDIQKKAANNI